MVREYDSYYDIPMESMFFFLGTYIMFYLVKINNNGKYV